MTDDSVFRLLSKEDADVRLAETFSSCLSSNRLMLRLQICDDRCLKSWVGIGDLTVYPENTATSLFPPTDIDIVTAAFRYGFFEWMLPCRKTIVASFTKQIANSEQITKSARRDSLDNTIREIAKAVVHVAWRCGFGSPVFDAGAFSYLSQLVPGQPVTVVADTNAVLQGALDFVMRQSTPNIEIKIPAIVHMEIVNFVDRYFGQRRANRKTARMLRDHVNKSGQHVLLRLHLDDSRSIVRTSLGSDPLRGIVQASSDAEDKNLNLQHVQRSFADRLILETAIQQLTAANVHHRVMLLTADQGLARMTLAEGAEPLFYDSNSAVDVFNSTLCGVGVSPFTYSGNQNRLYTISMSTLLWEYAATFGRARLYDPDSDIAFEVSSFGSRWHPYHALNKLMWVKSSTRQSTAQEATRYHRRKTDHSADERPKHHLTGSFKFSVNAMLKLMIGLRTASSMSYEEGMAIVRVGDKTFSEYRRFLVAGHFALRSGDALEKTAALDAFLEAIRRKSYGDIYAHLKKVPSFADFANALKPFAPLTDGQKKIRSGAFPTYCTLVELCAAGVRLGQEGIYATPIRPTARDFARLAVDAYRQTRGGDDYTLTGAWLEHLIRVDGIHPVRARCCLDEAHRKGYLRRFFEGSTPEMRHGNKNVAVLQNGGTGPMIRIVNLYHGDFLMPGRATVSLRVQKGDDNGT